MSQLTQCCYLTAAIKLPVRKSSLMISLFIFIIKTNLSAKNNRKIILKLNTRKCNVIYKWLLLFAGQIIIAISLFIGQVHAPNRKLIRLVAP